MSNSLKIIILSIVCFVLGTSEFVIVGVLDKIALSANISIAQAGQLITVFAITAAIGTPIAIYFLENVNRQYILIFALGIIALSCMLMSQTVSYSFMLLARIIMALGVGVFNVYCFTSAADLVPENKKASAIATVTIGYNAALIVGLPIGRMVTTLWGWHVIFGFTALFCLLAISVIYKHFPYLNNNNVTSSRNSITDLLKPRVFINLGVSFFWILGYSLLYSYITPYLKHTSSMDENVLNIALFAFGVATLIGNKSGGFLGEKIGSSKTILLCMVIHVASLVLLSLVSGSVPFTVFVLMLWAISAWIAGPILRFNMMDLSPDSPQFILSLYNSIIQLGFAVGAGLGGLEYANVPPVMLSWSAAGFVAIATFFTLFNQYGSMVLQTVRQRSRF